MNLSMSEIYRFRKTDLHFLKVHDSPFYIPSIASKTFESELDIKTCPLTDLKDQGALGLRLEIQNT